MSRLTIYYYSCLQLTTFHTFPTIPKPIEYYVQWPGSLWAFVRNQNQNSKFSRQFKPDAPMLCSFKFCLTFHSCLRVATTVPQSIFGCFSQAFAANIGLSNLPCINLEGWRSANHTCRQSIYMQRFRQLQCIHTVSSIVYEICISVMLANSMNRYTSC